MSDDTTTDRPEFVPIFAFAPTETYVHKVTVETPNQAGGWDKSTFDAEFLRVESDEYQDLIKKKPADVLDQVLVSEQFVATSRGAIGDLRRVEVFNDHLFEGRDRSRSDHGFVRALLRLRLPDAPLPAA